MASNIEARNGTGKQSLHAGQGDLIHGDTIHVYSQKQNDSILAADSFLDSLRRLSFDVAHYHEKLRRQRAQNTGNWVLHDSLVVDWLDSTHPHLLWMHGPLGCGKTFLASFIIDHLADRTAELVATDHVYLYFDDSLSQPSFKQILITILLQLLNQRLEKETLSKEKVFQYSHSIGSLDAATPETLRSLLLRLLRTSKKLYFVIDAIDKCEQEERETLLDTLRLLYGNLSVVKVLLTARSAINNGKELGIDPLILCVDESKIVADIESYVRTRAAETNKDFVLHDDGLAKQIANNAAGIFLLAKEHMDCLHDIQTYGEFKVNVETPPAAAYRPYNEILAQIMADTELGRNQHVARHVFTYLLYAKGHLTVQYLQESFAATLIDRRRRSAKDSGQSLRDHIMSKDRFISACGGLIAADPETGIISAVHPAVRRCVRDCGMICSSPHAAISTHCLVYLLSADSMGDLDKEIDCEAEDFALSFLKYAVSFWAEHLQSSMELNEEETTNALDHAVEFLSDTPRLTQSFCLASLTSGSNIRLDGISGLHAAVILDLPAVAERLIQKGCDVNAVCSTGRTPVHLAVIFQKANQVKLLMDAGATPDIPDHNGDTALHAAVIRDFPGSYQPSEHREVLAALLAHDNARAALSMPNKRGERPFTWALQHAPEQVARVLTQHQLPTPFAEPLTSLKWSPLREVMESVERLAAAKTLLSLLLEGGADPNAEMEDGWLALTNAIFHGRQDIAELLLQHKADPNINGRMYGTPLRLSVKLDQPSITHLLVRYADVNRVPPGEDPPLIYAARKHRNNHVWLLLDAGAQVDIQDSRGWTALHHAVHGGNDSLAWLLISKGASPDIPNQQLLSPLHLAVESRNYAMVQLFCLPRLGSTRDGGLGEMRSSQKPSLTLLDHQGMSPLHRAIQSNNIDIVQTLFRSGGPQCLDIKDACGAMPLHHAVTLDWYDGFGHIAFFLLDRDANPDARDNTGKTPLMWAAQKGDRNFVILLLGRLDNRNAQDGDGKTAEDLAMEVGREDVVSCIRFYSAT